MPGRSGPPEAAEGRLRRSGAAGAAASGARAPRARVPRARVFRATLLALTLIDVEFRTRYLSCVDSNRRRIPQTVLIAGYSYPKVAVFFAG